MSQPSTQTHPQTTAGNVTADNTARNASINESQPNPPSSAAGGGAEGLKDPEGEITTEQAKAQGLPEQKHAGAVGYGPDYANKNKPTMGEKFTGIKEELIGKVTKNPELAQHGRERKIGELKRKEQEEHETDPFATAEKKEPAPAPASNAQGPGASNTAVDGDANAGPGLGGGKSSEVDTAAGQSRIPPDSSHPAARDEGTQRAAAL